MKQQDEVLDELARRIAVAETEIMRLSAVILGLTQAGSDTTEAEALLQDYRRTLQTLRRQRWVIPARRMES